LGGAKARLQLVRAEGVLWIKAETQQYRQCDQPTAARNGINKAGHQSGSKEQREVPEL
jgi:hypothetical protein